MHVHPSPPPHSVHARVRWRPAACAGGGAVPLDLRAGAGQGRPTAGPARWRAQGRGLRPRPGVRSMRGSVRGGQAGCC
eukprot:353230-Chlamydomonas_euryale.AAC.1